MKLGHKNDGATPLRVHTRSFVIHVISFHVSLLCQESLEPSQHTNISVF